MVSWFEFSLLNATHSCCRPTVLTFCKFVKFLKLNRSIQLLFVNSQNILDAQSLKSHLFGSSMRWNRMKCRAQETALIWNWGNHQKLQDLLIIAESFPWHDIDIEMGCIFEHLCDLDDESTAVETLRILLRFGYSPFVNCRSCSTLCDYAESSKKSKLHKLN